MIRLLVLCLSLLGLVILLSSAVLNFLAPKGNEGMGQQLETVAGASVQEQEPIYYQAPRPSGAPPLTAPTNAPEQSTELSTVVGHAIDEQVSIRLGDFIETLVGDEERHKTIKDALTAAYATAASSIGSSQNQDPNFVVNALEGLLDDDELTQLETFLEESSRARFLETVSPQVDLISPSLDASSKQVLLETLFTETYAATNPESNSTGLTSDYLANQLVAIQRTRDAIRAALQPAQLELANDFLDQQAAAINMAISIFTTPNR